MALKPPLRVAVTGAAGQIGYSLLFRIASGEVFGPDQPVILQLLELDVAMKRLEGTAMELQDCAPSLVDGVVLTSDAKTAFKDINWALLVGSKPRGKGQERSDLIRDNGPIFTGQGKALQGAAADVRILVVGNPCNTNCLIARHCAPDIPDDRWFAMTQLDHNRARAQLAAKANVHVRDVDGVIIWGNHSATQFPDYQHARIAGKPAPKVIGDDAWYRETFIPAVQKRGAAIINARGSSSAASAANAAIDAVHNLSQPTPEGGWYSTAVVSHGEYDVPAGLVFSFPVRTTASGVEVVTGLEHGDFAREKIAATTAELEQEKTAVANLLS